MNTGPRGGCTMAFLLGVLLLISCVVAAFAQQPGPVVIQGPQNVTPYDCSGTITTGGTAQSLFAASPNVKGFMIMNLDTTEPLAMNFNGTAAVGTQGSYMLAAGTAGTFVNSGSFASPIGFGINVAPSIVAATTGHKYTCTKW